MTVRFLAVAEQELDEAAAFYRGNRQGSVQHSLPRLRQLSAASKHRPKRGSH
jgi:hypothetical protein